MSAEEADKTATTDASGGDEEEEWLYGDESESKEEDEEAKLNAAVSTPADAPKEEEEVHATGNGVASEPSGEAAGEDLDSDSDSDDDDDDVRVTIGDIKTGAPQYTSYGAPPVNLNIKTTSSRPYGQVSTKLKGVDLDAPGNINGVPVLEVDMESFEEKPWRKPGADLSDYFNYGFNEDTWKVYCDKQRRLRTGGDMSTVSSVTSKITVQQGRMGNDKDMSSLVTHTSKSDFTSPVNLYKSTISQVTRKPSSTIDVIGGQTATISRVEGRRRHNLEGNNIQVISEHTTSEAETTSAKMPTFFPPGPLPPSMPPPPFLPPPPNVSTAPPLIPPPRLPITIPPPGFPPPPSAPPPMISTIDSGHTGGYDGRSIPPYPFTQGSYPPPVSGGVPPPWPPLMESAKPWDYYPRRDDKRDKERDRDRDRGRERTHEREREHSPSTMSYASDEERYRYRDYSDRSYSERHRTSREKEERHRERRHREKDEGRHKSSRSSSRRRHDSEEGDSHRRHKHKKSKRSKEGKEVSEDIGADQENQEVME
ncbi:pre-mRNA 3'-end-processing factor FIP1 isoform X2 [Thalassophryne amazonica]|uniref:pre-mRNA 3'-end-processing factor FIP1 isoform X2 n=1 Tax=Thalassophryne amazonica TaxID=390379 RepID=UPI001470A6EF|nr:pre-mRNA 3'-end-processing factor FIP1 isoform X2 [Thalassophryne amazonica]